MQLALKASLRNKSFLLIYKALRPLPEQIVSTNIPSSKGLNRNQLFLRYSRLKVIFKTMHFPIAETKINTRMNKTIKDYICNIQSTIKRIIYNVPNNVLIFTNQIIVYENENFVDVPSYRVVLNLTTI